MFTTERSFVTVYLNLEIVLKIVDLIASALQLFFNDKNYKNVESAAALKCIEAHPPKDLKFMSDSTLLFIMPDADI